MDNILNNNAVSLFPLGGIAAGYIGIDQNARIVSFCTPGNDGTDRAKIGFALNYGDKSGKSETRVLSKNADNTTVLLGFDNVTYDEGFPFVNYALFDENCPIDVKMSAFGAFVPQNCADSQIPSVFFEVTLCNKSEGNVSGALCFYASDFFGESLVKCFADDKCAYTQIVSCEQNKTENISLSLCERDFSLMSFCGSENDFLRDFECGNILSAGSKQNNGGAVCCHFSIDSEKYVTYKFCLSWYYPYLQSKDLAKSYYSQYFDNSTECAKYCFTHFDRLKDASLMFASSFSNSTLSDKVKSKISNSLKTLIMSPLFRKNNGDLLVTDKSCSVPIFHSKMFVLSSLYPELDRALFAPTLDCLKEKDFCDLHENLLFVLCAYRIYFETFDDEFLIENWFYISKCIDYANVSYNDEEYDLYMLSVFAAMKLSRRVKDRVRSARYSTLFDNLSMSASQIILSRQTALLAKMLKLDDVFGSFNEQEEGDSEDLLEYTELNRAAGFYYNGDECSVSLLPEKEYFDEKGVFVCPWYSATGCGTLEAGIDYVEIQVKQGFVDVRSLRAQRRIFMIMYGGRKWRFEGCGTTAVLDNTLTVSPEKKLTVIIDAE